MEDYTKQHKEAWEFDAYNFWVEHAGKPEERAKEDAANPRAMLRRYADYFDRFEGVKVANICGSCGKKAIPLALLGADVTIFDISEANKRYALETAQAAHVRIGFEVCDVLEIDLAKYRGFFDVVFMEGGILHYFHDLDAFMKMMYDLLKPGGKMICSDFHPFTKIMDAWKCLKGKWPTPVFTRMKYAARFRNAVTGNIPSAKSSTGSSALASP